MLDVLFPDDHMLVHGGNTGVLPDATWVHGKLNRERLDERWPFTWWEVCYRRKGRIYVPQGQALAAKLTFLVHVLGPLRDVWDHPISIPTGGGFDPVTDENGYKITHRSSLKKDKFPDDPVRLSRSQHGYQVHRLKCGSRKGSRKLVGPTGTAWDFRLKGQDEKLREEVVSWLKTECPLPDYLAERDIRGISIGAYGSGSGNFVHGDLRPGPVARWRSKAPKLAVPVREGSWW